MSRSNRCIGIIMAGGSGERFWPLSRRLHPKQFLNLSDPDRSMLEEAVDRLRPLCGDDGVVVATTPWLVEPTRELLGPSVTLFAEPSKRNTSGCLVWAAAQLLSQGVDPESTSWAVVAADHRITPTEGFVRTVEKALEWAEKEQLLVTIGIRPNRAETGYGYIEISNECAGPLTGHRVQSFHEKPDRDRAESYVASRRFLWNSGMFFWTFSGFLDALQRHALDLFEAITTIAAALKEGDPAHAERIFEQIRNVSIDYALMEKASKVGVIEADFAWDDLGSWDALPRSRGTDEAGNMQVGESILVESSLNVVWNDRSESTLCLLGVEGLAVVQTEDCTLICPLDRAQEIRKLVEAVAKSRPQST